jgi:hypothetical protein
MKKWAALVFLLGVLAGAALWASPPDPPADLPRFTEQKELIRPEGYREWIFIGATLGVSYSDKVQSNPRFHNLYINPTAYREYQRSGRFPEGTIIMMEVLTAGKQTSIARQGSFEDQFVGVEAAVKDSSRFAESWAYFNFTRRGEAPAPTAKAFPKEACWNCHNEHAETDNVFTQFYPVLRRAK